MTTVLHFLAAIVALGATANAVISRAAGMQGDCTAWLVTTALALGVFLWTRHELVRREAQRRREMAAYREQWFASFDRRRRMRGAR
jgi:hypothetical protein